MRISDWSSDVCSSDLNYRGEAIGFKSITAYRGSSNHTFYDVDGTPLPITSQEQFDRYRQFSQELQLSSPEDAKALRWVAGLYYFRATTDQLTENIIRPPDGTFVNVLNNQLGLDRKSTRLNSSH